MATLTKGILHGFSGKVGDVVGSSWKGIQVLKSAPTTKRSMFSKSQILQQAKFMLLFRFLRPLTDLLNLTFKNVAKNMSCLNKAFSVNKDTVTGLYPSFRIEYAAVKLSAGTLFSAATAKATSPRQRWLMISWENDFTPNFRVSGSDILFVAVYSEELDDWYYNENAGARISGTSVLDISEFSGRQVHVYMGFLSVNGKWVSESLYLGRINIL